MNHISLGSFQSFSNKIKINANLQTFLDSSAKITSATSPVSVIKCIMEIEEICPAQNDNNGMVADRMPKRKERNSRATFTQLQLDSLENGKLLYNKISKYHYHKRSRALAISLFEIE
jgi:hypothetical protein